jgi:hypothetical protein
VKKGIASRAIRRWRVSNLVQIGSIFMHKKHVVISEMSPVEAGERAKSARRKQTQTLNV